MDFHDELCSEPGKSRDGVFFHITARYEVSEETEVDSEKCMGEISWKTPQIP